MKLAFSIFTLLALTACDRPNGSPSKNSGSASGVRVRGTTEFDVREVAGTNGTDTLRIIRTGPGGSIPGGTRTTGASIPSAHPVHPNTNDSRKEEAP